LKEKDRNFEEGLGEPDSLKIPEVENLVALSL
jgi:hypothetical protein